MRGKGIEKEMEMSRECYFTYEAGRQAGMAREGEGREGLGVRKAMSETFILRDQYSSMNVVRQSQPCTFAQFFARTRPASVAV